MKEKGKKREIRISVSVIHLRKEKFWFLYSALGKDFEAKNQVQNQSIPHNLTRGKASTHSWEIRNRVSGKLSIASFGSELSN